MKKLCITFIFLFIATLIFAQNKRKFSGYFLAEFNSTIYDRTIGNNPWGAGLGFQAFYNTHSKFKPSLEFTSDLYLQSDKLLRLDPDGSIPATDYGFNSMINLFIGESFHPKPSIYFSLLGGPSFIGGYTYFGIKPSFGFYFSKSQRLMGKFSYINIFNRYKTTKEDFGSISFAVGIKLF
jgi:hypothetical protein